MYTIVRPGLRGREHRFVDRTMLLLGGTAIDLAAPPLTPMTLLGSASNLATSRGRSGRFPRVLLWARLVDLTHQRTHAGTGRQRWRVARARLARAASRIQPVRHLDKHRIDRMHAKQVAIVAGELERIRAEI